jgi:hypothetical protein
LAKKIADRVKEAESKDEIMDLLNTLEKEIVKKIGLTSKSSLVLKEVEEGKNFLKDKSASSKMILENIFIKIHELFKK